MVFHTELAEIAEVGVPVGLDEGVTVGCQEGTSDDAGCTDDEDAKVPDGVGRISAFLIDEDDVCVCGGEDIEVDKTIDEPVEELLVVGVVVLCGDRTSPRLGKGTLVVVVES